MSSTPTSNLTQESTSIKSFQQSPYKSPHKLAGNKRQKSPNTATTSSSRIENKSHTSVGQKLKQRLNDEIISCHFDDEKINKISIECETKSEWKTFCTLKMTKESELVKAWVNLLSCIMDTCNENPRLYFHDTHKINMSDHHADYRKNELKPDITITTLFHTGTPTWQTATFLAEVKLLESKIDGDPTIGQLGRYLHYYRLANPHNVDRYGLLIAGKTAQIYNINPVGCSKSEIHDGSIEIKPLVKLVLHLCNIQKNIPCYEILQPNSSIWINPNKTNSNAPSTTEVKWKGKLELIFVATSLFGRITTVWASEPTKSNTKTKHQEIILKRTFLNEHLAWQESIILEKLWQVKVPGIPKLLNAGVAVYQENSIPITYTLKSKTINKLQSKSINQLQSKSIDKLQSNSTDKIKSKSIDKKRSHSTAELQTKSTNQLQFKEIDETLYQSILCTEKIEGLDALTNLPCKDLLLCLRDALKIIWMAWTKGSVLHRDISIGNVRGICITQLYKNQPALKHDSALLFNDDIDDPDSVLLGKVIDWGNASDHDEPTKSIADGQSGTLPFMSRRMHKALECGKPSTHLPLDDLESIVYLLLWALDRARKPKKCPKVPSRCQCHLEHWTTKACLTITSDIKDDLIKLNLTKQPEEDTTFNLIEELSKDWDKEAIENKLADLCYDLLSNLPKTRDMYILTCSLNPMKNEEFKAQVTSYSRHYFEKFVQMFTSYAWNCK